LSPKNKYGDQSALLADALHYSASGWSIIPTRGKKPAGPWKRYQKERPGPETVLDLFARPRVTGVAVILGRVSGGLAVRDFDLAEAYHTWARANPDDAATLPTVRTARGFHVYGRLAEEAFADFGDGELRADSGHYALLPPSRHPDGPTYTWVNPLPADSVVLPPLPPSLWAPRGEETQHTQHPKQHIACVPQAAVDAIEASLPHGPGQRNRKVFDLARRLKGIAGLDTSPVMLKAIVIEWHRRALPVIRTKEFAETWTDFQIAWLRVRKPHGTTIHAAYEAACRAPERDIDDNPNVGVLAAMCRILGKATSDRRFYLSCRTIEELFGVGRMTAWRLLQALQFYGVIELIENGTLKERQATTWRYTAHTSRRSIHEHD
jgi:hypothetical protein